MFLFSRTAPILTLAGFFGFRIKSDTSPPFVNGVLDAVLLDVAVDLAFAALTGNSDDCQSLLAVLAMPLVQLWD